MATGDRQSVLRTTKVRTTLKGDNSWIQRRQDPEDEEDEKPWLAEVRASRVNGAFSENPPETTPAQPEPQPKPSTDSPKAPSSGYLIRGVFTKTGTKPASSSSTNGYAGTSSFNKKPSEGYKKIAPHTVRPSLENKAVEAEPAISKEEQDRRTEAASNVLKTSAARQRSYVLSAAKKYESPPEKGDDSDQPVISFVAKRVQISDDEDSDSAFEPPEAPVSPNPQARPAPKQSVEMSVDEPAPPAAPVRTKVPSTAPEPTPRTKAEPAPKQSSALDVLSDTLMSSKSAPTSVSKPVAEVTPPAPEAKKAPSAVPEPKPKIEPTPKPRTPTGPPYNSATEPVTPAVPVTKEAPSKAPESKPKADPTPKPSVTEPVAPLKAPSTTPEAQSKAEPTPKTSAAAPAAPTAPITQKAPTAAPELKQEPAPKQSETVPAAQKAPSTTPEPKQELTPKQSGTKPSAQVTPIAPVAAENKAPTATAEATKEPSPKPSATEPVPAAPVTQKALSTTPKPSVTEPVPAAPVAQKTESTTPVPKTEPAPKASVTEPVPALSTTPEPKPKTEPAPKPSVTETVPAAPALKKAPSTTPEPKPKTEPTPKASVTVPVPAAPAPAATPEPKPKTEPTPKASVTEPLPAAPAPAATPEPKPKTEPTPKASVTALIAPAAPAVQKAPLTTPEPTPKTEPTPKASVTAPIAPAAPAVQKAPLTTPEPTPKTEPTPKARIDPKPVEKTNGLSDGDLLGLTQSTPQKPVSPVPTTTDLLTGADSYLPKSEKTKKSLDLLAVDVIPFDTTTNKLSTDKTTTKIETTKTVVQSKEPKSSTETVTITTTKTEVITQNSSLPQSQKTQKSLDLLAFDVTPIDTKKDKLDTNKSQSKVETTQTVVRTIKESKSSADPFDPIPIVSESTKSPVELFDPLLLDSENRPADAVSSLAQDVIPIDTDFTSLSTDTSKERFDSSVPGANQRSSDSISPWDRWTSPILNTTTEIRETRADPQPMETSYTSYTRRVDRSSQEPKSLDSDSKKGLVYVKEYVNTPGLSTYPSSDYTDYVTSTSSSYAYSSPSRANMTACTYCGGLVGNDAKITIEHLNISCHPECFKCGICSKPMGDFLDNMFLHRGTVHCENCYANVI